MAKHRTVMAQFRRELIRLSSVLYWCGIDVRRKCKARRGNVMKCLVLEVRRADKQSKGIVKQGFEKQRHCVAESGAE